MRREQRLAFCENRTLGFSSTSDLPPSWPANMMVFVDHFDKKCEFFKLKVSFLYDNGVIIAEKESEFGLLRGQQSRGLSRLVLFLYK